MKKRCWTIPFGVLLCVMVATSYAGQTTDAKKKPPAAKKPIVKKPATKQLASLTGSWSLKTSWPGQGIVEMGQDMTLKQSGTALSGTVTGNAPVKGTLVGAKVKFKVKMESTGEPLYMVYTGKVVSASMMKGKATVPGLAPGQGYDNGTWTASR